MSAAISDTKNTESNYTINDIEKSLETAIQQLHPNTKSYTWFCNIHDEYYLKTFDSVDKYYPNASELENLIEDLNKFDLIDPTELDLNYIKTSINLITDIISKYTDVWFFFWELPAVCVHSLGLQARVLQHYGATTKKDTFGFIKKSNEALYTFLNDNVPEVFELSNMYSNMDITQLYKRLIKHAYRLIAYYRNKKDETLCKKYYHKIISDIIFWKSFYINRRDTIVRCCGALSASLLYAKHDINS